MLDDREFRILAVCTGNVCRSPLLEKLLQTGLDRAAPGSFSVRSAGTRALVGHSATDEIEALGAQMGLDFRGFAAQQISPQLLNSADLVLTLTRAHSVAVLEDNPLLLRRTFSLREFARLLPSVQADITLSPQQRWQSAVQRAPRSRGAVYVHPDSDDVVDPYRRSEQVLRQMADQLIPAAESIINWEITASMTAP